MTIETLHDNPWLSLKVIREPLHGVSGYVFSHESSCGGRKVALLPFRNIGTSREYLVRREITPCWSRDPQLSAITGGWEGGGINDDAVRELAEEAGYEVTHADLILLGVSRASKSADTIYHLFAVDVTGLSQGAAAGDGSALETSASVEWLYGDQLADVGDPQVALMYLRLLMHLRLRQSTFGHKDLGSTAPNISGGDS